MPAATDGNAVVRHLCAVLVCLLIIRSNEGGFCCVPSVCGVGRLAEDQQYLRWRVGSVACPLCAVLAGLPTQYMMLTGHTRVMPVPLNAFALVHHVGQVRGLTYAVRMSTWFPPPC